MKQPVISIITVVYNGKKVLPMTIKSIATQTYDNIEYIIIDGASTDSTLDVIEKNKNIVSKFVSEPDRGIYDAMNKGLKIATGDYVWFLNAGDEIYSSDTISKVFELEEADAYYGDVGYIDENEEDLGTRTLKTPPESFSWKDMIWGMVVSHQSFIVKRKYAVNYDLRYKYTADVDWMIKTLKNCKTIGNTKLILSKFLVGGFSKKNIISSNRERFSILRKHFDLYEVLKSHALLSKDFIKYYLSNKKKYY
ncbi:MAG: glycosyltransferase [Ignavibacteriae bacterium]|nr:glycosyltransferase [Ignavibacteriota bacterium]MCB9242145.1 glycosyltransferase [Ignavibacteriales bacterium]